jgi:hypothetical protein
MRADRDLPWFYGTGPSTAAGDSGLRSSLGGQLAALEAGIVGEHAVNTSRLEDDMIRRTSTGALMSEIRERLSQLPRDIVLVLELHYSTRPIAYGISGCAVLCDAAAALVAPAAVSREGIAGVLRERVQAGKPTAWVDLDTEAVALLKSAQLAYEAIRIVRRRRVWAE